MKRIAASLGVLAIISSSGCWKPYYNQQYAQPAYTQPAAYTQAPAYQQGGVTYTQPPIVQSQPQVIPQAAPVIQTQPATVVQQYPSVQGCPPVYCQPQPCTPCY